MLAEKVAPLVARFLLVYLALVAIGSLIAWAEMTEVRYVLTAPMDTIAKALDNVR